MTKNINELDPDERTILTKQIETIAPAHTHWAVGANGRVGTWSSPEGLWSIEISFPTGRYTLRCGDNKWVRFDNDIVWLRDLLVHVGAIE